MRWRTYPSLPSPGERVLAKVYGCKRATYFVLDIKHGEGLGYIEKWIPFEEVVDFSSFKELEKEIPTQKIDPNYADILKSLDKNTLDEHERVYQNIREILQDNPHEWSPSYLLHTVLAYLLMIIYDAAPDEERAEMLIQFAQEVGKRASIMGENEEFLDEEKWSE